MIWLVFPFLCFLIYLFCRVKNIDKDFIQGWLIVTLVVVLLTLAVSFFVTGTVISYKTELIRVSRDIIIAEERFEGIKKTILSYADKYPAEADLLKSFNPVVLLRLPEIKSDVFLVSQIQLAVEYQDSIYELKMDGNSYKESLDFHSYRWFSPTLVNPSYD